MKLDYEVAKKIDTGLDVVGAVASISGWVLMTKLTDPATIPAGPEFTGFGKTMKFLVYGFAAAAVVAAVAAHRYGKVN